jgi:acetyl esterase/lipase
MKKFLITLIGLALTLAAVQAQSTTNYTRVEDVIYGRKFGVALTMDIFKPDHPNGAGIIAIVSGGWLSSHEAINPAVLEEYLRRDYTVFAVVHGSQPKFVITEAIQDVNRAVRFIRHNAATYGIDPNRLGVTGGSAGGHLSLSLGTRGGPGDADSKDPVDRESSAVQCVACFFPPTDFLNYGKHDQDATGVGALAKYAPAFGPRCENPGDRKVLGREISPIYYVTSNMPPTLIIHGNADGVVPIQQSEKFVKKANEAGATVKLVVKEGLGHGWLIGLTNDLSTCADWFDQYLKKPVAGSSKGQQ